MLRTIADGKEDGVDQRHEERASAEAAAWNARRGEVWVELQDLLDRLFRPIEQVLAETVRTDGAHAVLDIGCGAGATTLAVARHLAPDGRCTGLDVSVPLVEAARRRSGEASIGTAAFVVGDAQRHAFRPGTFDAAVSRFGVMFFDDPEAAFTNIRSGARGGAWLTAFVWRDPDDNPFMTAAERAVAPLLGLTTSPERDRPGRFAFADPDRVRRILAVGGWQGSDIRPLDIPCSLTREELAIYARRMGRIGVILPDLDVARREEVEAALDRAFAPYISDGVARFEAACWIVRARAG